MANLKKVSALVLLLCGFVCLCLLSGCDNPQPTEPTTTPTTEVPDAIYTISVKTAGGLMLSDEVDYCIFDSAERNYIVKHGPMPKDGIIIFTAPRSDDYIFILKDVPLGYDVQGEYKITSTKLDIVLTASVITEGNATDRVYGLGDVITDFTVTDTDGNVHTISEILKTKEAVVLNFWYTGCGPCKMEFPLLQKAYDLYKDKLEVIAMDSYKGETEEDVAKFKADNGLTFPMAKVDSAWNTSMQVQSYPRTVIIDRYGVICLIETGSVLEEGVFEGAFNYFTQENYTQRLVEEMKDLDTLSYPEGHKRNPQQIQAAVGQFAVNVEAGKEFYCNIFNCDGIIFFVENPDVYVMYGGRRYDANEQGVIEFELSCKSANGYAQVMFGSDSEEPQNFVAKLNTPPGTINTPIDISYGELSVLLEQGRDEGLYYIIAADKTGFIHLTVTGISEGADYEIEFYNMNTAQTLWFSTSCVEDVDGNYVTVVPVNAKDVLRIGFSSRQDRTGNYPEMTIQALVSYSEHGGTGSLEEIPYSLTFKDVEGLPMAGVTATFTVNGEAVVLVSDENGSLTTMLPSGSYLVQVVFPEGFTADATQYLLTPDETTKEIVVRLNEQKQITYTIHVQDHDGLPVAGTAVTVGTSFAITDENGNVVFTLPAGNYVATIVAPEGYVSKEDKYYFGVRPDVTIVLENNQSATKIPYTVTVLDGYGDPYTNVMVRFYAADGTETTVRVSADGVATATLIRGNYTVKLLFQQGNMYYENAGLQLTAEVTSTTITVAPGVTGKPGQVKPTTSSSTFDAYYIQVGNVYVEMEPLSLTYFLFKPTKTGTYKIYTNKLGAAIENWQTTTQTTPNASGVENNVFTLEVTEVGMTYVIAIDAAYDVSNTILTVFRLPDCIVDEYPVTPELPETPYAPHLPGYAQIKYPDFMGTIQYYVDAEGFYHLDNEDGPIVLIDLLGERFGVSIVKLLSQGEMAWYTYDEDGYPIYKKDYTACMNAYLAVMEPTRGLYPLTADLYTMLKEYGDHAGWWDPNSEAYLFDGLVGDLLLPDYAWQFLCCYIYIDPALCEHGFTEWTLTEDGTTLTRNCPYCELTENHVIGGDCCAATAGEWVMNMETLSYTSTCTICGQDMIHVINESCDDSTCNQWALTQDGNAYERLCRICHSLQTHVTGTDCKEEHYGQWLKAADGVNYERACTICGHLQTHATGTDCQETHYGQWTLAADGLHYERTCSICGNLQTHATGTDCQGAHYGQWALAADGTHYERTCGICGNLQKHVTGTDCDDATCGQWTVSADGRSYERTCSVCATTHRHVIGADCNEHYGHWEKSENGLTATRSCAICGNTQVHTVGDDCEAHYSAWAKSEDGSKTTRSCTVCGNTQTHTIGTDCEAHYSAWNKSENGLTATRFCNICDNTQTHSVGADCEGHYGEWVKSADGLTATRTCTICGNSQTHTVGVDCENHYGEWIKSEDGKSATKTCTICGNVQTHTAGDDCEGHYGEWINNEDGVNQDRTCEICGNQQTQPIPAPDPVIPEEPEEPVEPEVPDDPEVIG